MTAHAPRVSCPLLPANPVVFLADPDGPRLPIATEQTALGAGVGTGDVEQTGETCAEEAPMLFLQFPILCAMAFSSPGAHAPMIKHSDVAFMGQAGRKVYTEYGGTVIAWGGTPDPESLKEADGLKWFGSVGMVTEFGQYYERFPQTWEEALCRDIDGKPVKVPWLTDLSHKGTPFWWCCTNHPQFRQFLRERVVQIIKGGATGLHVDDHMGTSGNLWLGACLCDRCVAGFRAYLKTLPNVSRLLEDPAE
jgi:hypothetical protein